MFLPTSAILHKNCEQRLICAPYTSRIHSKYRSFVRRGVDSSTSIWAKLSTFMFGRFGYSSFNGRTFVSQDCHLYDEKNIIYSVPGHMWCSNKASVAGPFMPETIYYVETIFNHNISIRRSVDLGGSFFLTHPVISNFGHDLCQVLPWIHKIATNTDNFISMPELVIPNLGNLINAVLGSRFNDVIRPLSIGDNEHVSPRNGFFCDPLSHNTGGNYLRSLFFSNMLDPLRGISSWDTKGCDKVLLMRGATSRIANSGEILSFCSDHSIRIINPLETPIFDLIEQLQFARVVIVEPGASVNNLFFAPRDTIKVILWPSRDYKFANPWWNAVWPTAPFMVDSDITFFCSSSLASQIDDPSVYSVDRLAHLLSDLV